MKKRKKLFISIFSIFAFVLSIFSISNVYAYDNGFYIDNNYNLSSLNLADLNKIGNVQASNSYIYSVNNQVLFLKQTTSYNDPYIYFNNFITLSPGTYNLYFNSDLNEVQYFGLTENNTTNFVKYLPLDNSSTSFIVNNTTTYGLGFEGNSEINREFNIRVMVSSGSEQLNYFPYGTYYNSNYLQVSNLGIFSYLGYVQAYMPNHTSDEYDLDFLLGNGYFDNGYFDLNRFNLFVNPDYSSVRFYFYFDFFVSNSNFNLNFSSETTINLFRITGWNSSGLNSEIYVFDDVNLPISFNLSNYSTIPYEVESFDIAFNSSDDIVNIVSNQSYLNGYNSGYNSGYFSGKNDNDVYYKSLYDNLLIQYNDLQELYDDYVNGNVSFNTLVWNIATIPFESFKQIWNVDLLGLNIGNFVTALMFVGVVVYIWKKFL